MITGTSGPLSFCFSLFATLPYEFHLDTFRFNLKSAPVTSNLVLGEAGLWSLPAFQTKSCAVARCCAAVTMFVRVTRKGPTTARTLMMGSFGSLQMDGKLLRIPPWGVRHFLQPSRSQNQLFILFVVRRKVPAGRGDVITILT